MLGKAESLGVAHFKGRGDVATTQAANCFGDQGLTEVNSGDEAVWADPVGEVEGVGAHATPDVQDVRSSFKAEPIDKRRFPGDDSWQFVGRVEETQKETGVGCVIDCREMRYVQVIHVL